jgi:hypothetical protein
MLLFCLASDTDSEGGINSRHGTVGAADRAHTCSPACAMRVERRSVPKPSLPFQRCHQRKRPSTPKRRDKALYHGAAQGEG